MSATLNAIIDQPFVAIPVYQSSMVKLLVILRFPKLIFQFDEGPVPEMSIWSMLLYKSDSK